MQQTSVHSCLGTLTSKKCCFRMTLMTLLTLVAIGALLFNNQSFQIFPQTWIGVPENTSAVDRVTESQVSEEFCVPYPHHYSLIVDQPHRCAEDSPFLVLMVPVSPQERRTRDIIRETWGGQTAVLGKTVQLYFILGHTPEENRSLQQQILEESQRHGDVIQLDFVDSYRNLSIKTMLMLEWLAAHCNGSSYAIKIDSDVFLNVPNLVRILLDAPPNLYVTGLVARQSPVIRDSSSKWYLPYSVFPDSSYPPYALGLGYVFSMDMAEMILKAAGQVKAVYIEDVYVGLCLEFLGVAVTDPPHGDLFRAGAPFFLNKCYWTTIITTILSNSEQLLETWRTYQSELQSC